MTRHRFMQSLTSRFARAMAITLLVAGMNVAASAQTLLFANKTVLSVDATAIQLKGEVPPREYPHMNYRSQVKFEDAARAWASSHFMTNGTSVNTLVINIRKGDIVEKLLPIKKGIKGWFTKDQSAAYEATLDLELAIVDPNGTVLSTASGKASTSRTVPEGTTEADKQQVWAGLIVATFDNLDNELLPQVRQAMAQFIR
jgi:hypothetical protein